MKLVLKRWFIQQHFGESADISTEEIIKKYSIVYQCDDKSYGVLYSETPKAIKFIKTDEHSGKSVFAFAPQSALIVIDETMEQQKQIDEYDYKSQKSLKNVVFNEVKDFLKNANIWGKYAFDKSRVNSVTKYMKKGTWNN